MSAAVPAPATGEPAAPAKGRKKLIIVLTTALLVVLAGAGGTVFWLKQRAAAAADEGSDDSIAAAATGAAEKHADRVAPTFVALEPFVVNLADKDAERYAQVGLTLEVDDPKFAEEMKLYMPAIRNAILMILAHKSSAELLERSGKQLLAAEIMRESVRPLGIEIDPETAADTAPATTAEGEPKAAPAKVAKPRKPVVHNPVRRVHFASFIVQ